MMLWVLVLILVNQDKTYVVDRYLTEQDCEVEHTRIETDMREAYRDDPPDQAFTMECRFTGAKL